MSGSQPGVKLDSQAEIAKEGVLSQQVHLRNYGDRMVTFAEEHGLPLDRPVSRKELMDLDYAMINTVGEGEKVIVGEGKGEDWKGKALLTKEELAINRQELDAEGLDEKELKEIGADMENFIDEVQELTLLHQHLGQRGIAQTSNRLNVVAHDFKLMDRIEGADLLDWRKKAEIIIEVQKKVAEKLKIADNVRGISVKNFERRGESKVTGEQCPSLDCDHRFRNPGGALIYDTDGKISGKPGTLRLNSVVAHLAEHGISETGVASHDQRYMTIKEYLPIFAKRTESNPVAGLDERLVGLGVFVESAKEWLEKAGITTVAEEELITFGKERLFFIKDET